MIVCLITTSVAQGATGLLKTVPASDVSAKIDEADQPIEFDNCTIVGDLNPHSRNVSGQVHFNNSFFKGRVHLNSTNFKGPVYFRKAIFASAAEFNESKFDGPADFSESKFNGSADFRWADFNNTAYLNEAHFNGSSDFRWSNFRSDAYLSKIRFNCSSYFSWVNFTNSTSNADFELSNFRNDADFKWSKFNGYADFKWSKFNVDTTFTNSKFNSDSDFSWSQFNSSVYFSNSKFNGSVEFHGSKFNKKAFFYDAEFNGSTSFSQGEFAEDAFFDGAVFRGKLSLTRMKYDKLYIRWDNITRLEYDESAYQLLIGNFKKFGYYDDADNGYYQFRTDRFLHRKLGKDPLMYILDLGAWIFYGFGKRPILPLVWSIGTVLLFGVFWSAILTRGGQESYSTKGYGTVLGNSTDGSILTLEQGGKKHPKKSDIWNKIHSVLDPFSFSATIFLSSTRLFIDPPEIPKSLRWSPSIAKDMFTLERILGAFFSILLFLAIGGTVVR